MGEFSRERFVEQVIDRVHGKFPLVRIAASPDLFAVSINDQLAPLENLYRMAALSPEELDHHVDRWIVELLRAGEGSPDQVAPFEQIKDRILPMVLAAPGQIAHSGIISLPLIEGLIVSYVLDSDRSIAYIPESHFAKWGISPDELSNVALANLVTKSQAMQAHAAQDDNGKINLVILQTMDGYDASRILLPTLHDRLREHLGSPFAAGIPNRDILLCFRNDDPAFVERMHTQIKDDFRRMPHEVTDRLFLITPDGIAPR